MNSQQYPVLNVIGLMSGTSVDSIDAACIRVQLTEKPLRLSAFDILGTATQDLTPDLRQNLLSVMAHPEISLEKLCRLNVQVGMAFADTAMALVEQLAGQQIPVSLIASHGQTLFHMPPTSGALGATLQIGEPSIIAERTGIEVAADFRPGDMAAGGHGAPLVPFADQLLFQHPEHARAVQNIGGIANLTALPAIQDASSPLIAFDTGPGNMIIDALVETLFHKPYDDNGTIAQQGRVHPAMLEAMMRHPYFDVIPPKSTGRELFGKGYVETLLTDWQDRVSPQDLVATATAFTAQTIVQAYERFVLPTIPVKEVVVGGGGVFNQCLMRLLSEGFAPLGITLKRHEDLGIPSKYKEAIAFALLGYARKMGITSNIPSCTGAAHPVSLGGLWKPPV